MGVLIIDDRDPAVSYSANGDWQQGGVSQEYNTTTTWTTIAGATAQLTFSGTSIGVYGTIANIGLGVAPESSYSIDGGTPTLYNATMLNNSIQYRQQFFQSNSLSAGSGEEHTLVVTTLTNGGYFYLDYFEVVEPDTTTGTSTSTSQLSTPSTSLQAPVQVQSQHSSSTASAPAPLGAIIGGVLGSLGLLVIAFIAFLFLRRKRNDESCKNKNMHESAAIPSDTIAPYPVYQNAQLPQPHLPPFSQPFGAAPSPATSMSSLNNKRLPASLSQGPFGTENTSSGSDFISNLYENLRPTHDTSDLRLPSRTENISSGLTSNSHEHIRPSQGGSTSPGTPRLGPAPLDETPFEAPPPRYDG